MVGGAMSSFVSTSQDKVTFILGRRYRRGSVCLLRRGDKPTRKVTPVRRGYPSWWDTLPLSSSFSWSTSSCVESRGDVLMASRVVRNAALGDHVVVLERLGDVRGLGWYILSLFSLLESLFWCSALKFPGMMRFLSCRERLVTFIEVVDLNMDFRVDFRSRYSKFPCQNALHSAYPRKKLVRPRTECRKGCLKFFFSSFCFDKITRIFCSMPLLKLTDPIRPMKKALDFVWIFVVGLSRRVRV